MIFNRSLSAYEVQALYANTSSKYLGVNFTGLGNGLHASRIYSQDEFGNVNVTLLRTISVDSQIPNATLLSPANNSYVNNRTQNFTANLSDETGLLNATLFLSQEGNTWLEFDGNGSYVDAGTGFNNISDVSISVWFKANTRNKPVFSKIHNSTDYWMLQTRATSDQIQIYDYINNANTLRYPTPITFGQWYHAVVILKDNEDGTYENKLYLNGTLKGSGENSSGSVWKNSSGNLYVGGYKWTSTISSFNGSIDEVRVYNRSLSASEIAEIYRNGLQSNERLIRDGLVSWYDFEPGSNASQLVDKAYGINNGTIINATWSSLEAQSSVSLAEGVLNTVVGIVKTIADGIYKWFYRVFDRAGNMFTTSNYTLTVDTIYPVVNFTAPTPANNTGRTNEFLINASIEERNLANITYNWNGTQSTIPYSDAVLIMNFENNSVFGENSSYVVDFSRSGNNGTIYGNATFNSSCGKYGSGICLDGGGNYVRVGIIAEVLISNFSVSFWVYQKF